MKNANEREVSASREAVNAASDAMDAARDESDAAAEALAAASNAARDVYRGAVAEAVAAHELARSNALTAYNTYHALRRGFLAAAGRN